jgi:hypothetical protein
MFLIRFFLKVWSNFIKLDFKTIGLIHLERREYQYTKSQPEMTYIIGLPKLKKSHRIWRIEFFIDHYFRYHILAFFSSPKYGVFRVKKNQVKMFSVFKILGLNFLKLRNVIFLRFKNRAICSPSSKHTLSKDLYTEHLLTLVPNFV